nr:hypothetical protein [Bacillus pumilus]
MKKTCMWMTVGLLALLISGCMGTKEQTEGNQRSGQRGKGSITIKRNRRDSADRSGSD